MSLQRIEKIYCYARPCKSHFQLLSSKVGLHPIMPRGLHSETLIQKNNLLLPKSGDHQNQKSYIDSLCKSFDLSCATNLSPFGNLSKEKKKKEEPLPMPAKREPCKRCAKIRSNVKKFFNTKFLTANSKETEFNQPKLVPMQIHKNERNQITLIPEFHNIREVAVARPRTVCFGCVQPEREPSIRGPPIISPVCHVLANPRGEVYKNFPERVKKIAKIDRPRSLGLKRLPNKDPTKETSVHETNKPYGR